MKRWIRRLRNSHGYGVQSPNDFYFVRHVLREELPYYGYAVLDKLTEVSNDCLPCYPSSTNRLLFRLANYIHADVMIEVGAGLSVVAMATACPSARCIAVTASGTCDAVMQSLSHTAARVEMKNGDEMAVFCQLIHELGSVDMLHIAHTPYYREVVEAALPYVNDRTLIVVNGIRESKEKEAWWMALHDSPQVGVSYDLGIIGLLFFDKARYKDTYWINLKD